MNLVGPRRPGAPFHGLSAARLETVALPSGSWEGLRHRSVESAMSLTWYLWQSGSLPAADNMAADEALLLRLPRLGKPALRFYGWTGSPASFGYSQRYGAVAAMTELRPLVRRPTGGGLVPHDRDWTYSLFFPAADPWHGATALESYRRVHEWIRAAFARLRVATALSPTRRKDAPGQCFVGAERFDLLFQGRKIAGAAQRRTREGLLIQGSIQPPPAVAKVDWQKAMCDEAVAAFGVQWAPFDPDTELRDLIDALVRDKYGTSGYNERH